MKLIVFIVLLFALEVLPQTYLGISFNDGSSFSSTGVNQIKKITFSGNNIIFLLANDTTVSKPISSIGKMTSSNTGGNNPLPVELVNFTASVIKEEVNLKWTTATEQHNLGFEIERKEYAAEKWVKAGFAKGSGNSNAPIEYSFQDSPKGGTKFNYRLKQIDADGKYKYSNIIEITLGLPIQYELKQNYPNPFNPTTKIDYNLPNNEKVTLKVYDILGTEVAALINEEQKAGRYQVQFDASHLSSGLYLCRINAGNYKNTIKMLLVK